MAGRDQDVRGNRTSPGYTSPDEPISIDRPGANVTPPVEANIPRPAKVPRQPSPPPPRHPALYTAPPPEHMRMVEIEVVHETGSAPSQELFQRCVEVWTQNHVYVLDPQMTCTTVRSVASGQPVAAHELLGSRMVGGQLDGPSNTQLSYPFPAPGSTAVFQSARDGRRQYSRTSAVSRVVVRLHVLTVTVNDVIPTWKEITSPRQHRD